MRLTDIIDVLQKVAPLRLAESWDNVGLLLGNEQQEVKKVITCLTVTREVVEEAINEQAGLIVSHHPILFRPVQRMTADNEEGRLLLALGRAEIAVYSPHTAYDNAEGGINDQLASALRLTEVLPLLPSRVQGQFKIVVFVPSADVARVSDALFQAGAGIIGNYEQCSFRLPGTGTFFGGAGAQPAIGRAARFEEVSEVLLEVVCTSEKLSKALAAMKAAHTYEEPAFDVYPLHQTAGFMPTPGGSGRIGKLPQPVAPAELARSVSDALHTSVMLTGSQTRAHISTVAIVCGAGGSLLEQAIRSQADAFLTGEIRFHDELAAQAAGVLVIAAGHYATERPGVEILAARLASFLPSCRVWASCAEQNPARWVHHAVKPRTD